MQEYTIKLDFIVKVSKDEYNEIEEECYLESNLQGIVDLVLPNVSNLIGVASIEKIKD